MARRDFGEEETSIRLNAANQHISAMNARIRQMEDQHKTQTEHQMAEISRLRHMEDSARALCTTILSKDRSELILGTDYTWNQLSTEELIHKTVASYKKYCASRTKDIQKIKDYAVEKADELQDAKEKIQELLLTQTNSDKAEEISKVLQEKLTESEKAFQKAYRNMNIIQTDDETEFTQEIVSKTARSVNEEIMKETLQKGYQKQMRARAAEDEEKKLKRKRAEIDNVDAEVITLESILTDDERLIIKVLGKGLSLSTEIRKMSELTAKDFRTALMGLDRKNIISTYSGLYIPGSGGTPNIHILSTIGEKIYKIITNEYPAISEASRIKAAHANYEHGYGIRELAKLLNKSKRYEHINMFVQEINLGNGNLYRPDVQAIYKKDEDGTAPMPDYFEYERVKQTPEEYFAKFNKMALITDGINVVVPSANDHKTMQKYMYEWAMKNKDNPRYSETILRLTSISVLTSVIETLDFNEWWKINSHISRFPAPTEKKNK